VKSARFAALGMIGTAILLAGCQMNVITKIESSGAGTLTTEVGMSPEEVEQLRSLAGDPTASACESLSLNQESAAAASDFEEELRGEETWCVSMRAFDDLESLAGLYRDFETVTVRELVLREGLVVYDIEVGTAAGEGPPTPVEMTWTVELPGKIGSHNADAVNGNQLVWHLTQGEVMRLQAASDLYALDLPFDWNGIGRWFPGWVLAAVLCSCCGGVLVLVIVVALLLRRKR
jgi:hypothetical protein